jgi:hypothetical protein
MTDLKKAAQQALEALEALDAPPSGVVDHYELDRRKQALRDALPCTYKCEAWPECACAAQQEQEPVKPTMPITDDHGQAIKPQFQVIKAVGNWRLLYDQLCAGEAVRHEFRITKTTHDIALYPGISLADAIKRFDEKVEAEHE